MNGNGTESTIETHAPSGRPPNYTRDEEARLRALNRSGASTAELTPEIRKTRPWVSDSAGQNWKNRRGLTKGRIRGRRNPPPRDTPEAPARATREARRVEITVKAPGSEPVQFKASPATTRAVIELLVGV